MATTPPPRQSVNTPPTPLHGAKFDDYQPYSPRKSTRNTTKRNLHFERTPPPPSSNHNLRSSSSSTSPKFRKLGLAKQSSHTFSPPSSAQSSPQTKKGTKSVGTSDRVTRSKDSARHSFTITASSLEAPSQDNNVISSSSKSAVATAVGMLPTPAKTPRKRPSQPAPALKATARVLFPSQPTSTSETISSPKKKVKKGRKYNGFSLDSFTSEDGNQGEDGKIAIFTDSKDRVPETDESEDNPFYVKKSSVQPSGSRVSRRKKIVEEMKRDPKIEEALNRDDGLVYVFRGKKFFRKFEDEADEAEMDATKTSPRLRPLTRSSLKPRLLFPPTAEPELVDEEAITDIEEQAQAGDSEMTDVAADTEDEHLTTPVNNVFPPYSPPTSGRATRASAAKRVTPEPVEYLPADTKKAKKTSPFDGWQRSKAGVGAGPAGKGKKREGDVIERNGNADGKRIRSGAA